jgi:hypothetical protein
MIRACALLVVSAAVCPGVSAQEILWQRLGEKDVQFLDGWPLILDDLDGDGYDEVLQLAETAVSDLGLRNDLLTLSGRDGRVVRLHRTPELCFYYALEAAGDVDGDGVRDYAVRMVRSPTGSPNVVEVRSGRDEHVIWSVAGQFSEAFGFRIAGDLDLNGDGRPDLLVSALREGAGVVHAYGHRGQALYSLPMRAWSLAPLGGDLDGDGSEDFLAGVGDPQRFGFVHVCSGRDGRILVTGRGEQPGDDLGIGESAGCGDVDGDGVLDFAGSTAGSFGRPNLLRVFSGATGQPIHSIRKPTGVDFGRFVISADLDRDGVLDLLVGSGELAANGNSGGSIWWYSLRDGSLVTTIYPPGLPTKLTYFAWYGSVGRPHPGDIFPVFTSPDHFGDGGYFAGLGRATLFRAAPPGVVARGAVCKGSLPQAPRIGLRDLGARGFRVHLSKAPPAASAILMLGSSRTPFRTLPIEVDLDRLGFTGCSLQVPIELALPVVTGTTGIDAGYAFLDVPCALNSGAGFALHAQWLVLGTGAQAPGALSDALTTRH